MTSKRHWVEIVRSYLALIVRLIIPKCRSLLLAILLIVSVAGPVAPQGRSPLLDRIVAAVRKANPKWHFIGVCTCAALVPSQASYAAGGWHLGKLTSTRHVSIYISYVPSLASATDWMSGFGRGDLVTGWQRERYAFADDAFLLTSNIGYAILTFRSGSIIMEISGALDDVKFFASHANP